MSAFCIPLPSLRFPFQKRGSTDGSALARSKSVDSDDTLVSAVLEKGPNAVEERPVLSFAEAAERVGKVRELMKEAGLDY